MKSRSVLFWLIMFAVPMPRVSFGLPTRNALLLQAVQKQDRSAVRRLLAQGASANARDDRGRTALMWAASKADIALCQLLRQHGAKLDLADNDGNTALWIAVCQGDGYGVSPDADLPPQPPEADYIKTIHWLVEKGADVNRSARSGNDILLAACYSLQEGPAVCAYLIHHGASIPWPPPYSDNLLDYAIARNREDLLTLVLQKKPPQQVRNRALLSALGVPHRSQSRNPEARLRFARQLLEAGAKE